MSVSCVTCRVCEAVGAKVAPSFGGVFRIRVLLLVLVLLLRPVAPLVSRTAVVLVVFLFTKAVFLYVGKRSVFPKSVTVRSFCTLEL